MKNKNRFQSISIMMYNLERLFNILALVHALPFFFLLILIIGELVEFSIERVSFLLKPTYFLSKNGERKKFLKDPGSRSVLIMKDGYRESARFIIERETQ